MNMLFKYLMLVKLDTYNCLAILRVILALIPQLGYIHPDEYFQTVEVLAGKFLDVEHQVTWEFNISNPIRSMFIPYWTIGMNLKFLKGLNYVSSEYFSTPLNTPYFVLIFPRLLICLLSFFVDFSLYKTCVNNNEKCKSKLLILASSYVMLIYGSRTFTNTIELILFALLLYFVCDSLIMTNILLKHKEYLNYRYNKSKSLVERAKFHKLRLYLTSDSLTHCFPISTIVVLGFFNRPTFLAFAVIPVFFWLYRGIAPKSVTALKFHTRIFIFALYSLPTFFLVIVCDSFYYGHLTWGEIGMLDVSINNFIFTPLNFIKYNMDSNNLKLHGLHSRLLHALVNIPLLFNILAICGYLSLSKYLLWFIRRKYHLLPSVRSIKGLMTLSAIVPVSLLSFFPHQEPRFLIPIILPLTYLYSNIIYPEIDNELVEVPKLSLKPKPCKPPKRSYFLLRLWVTFNLVCTLFYGFLHQGGVFPATNYLSNVMKSTSPSTEFHIVTSHIYSIPESLFLQKPSNKLYTSKNSKYSVNRRVYLYEEGSKDLNYIITKCSTILEMNENMKSLNHKKYKVYLLISSSLRDKLNKIDKQQLKLNYINTFYPHLSTEAFPDLTHFCLEITQSFYKNCKVLNFEDFIWTVFNMFGLDLFEIS